MGSVWLAAAPTVLLKYGITTQGSFGPTSSTRLMYVCDDWSCHPFGACGCHGCRCAGVLMHGFMYGSCVLCWWLVWSLHMLGVSLHALCVSLRVFVCVGMSCVVACVVLRAG